MAEQNEAEWRT